MKTFAKLVLFVALSFIGILFLGTLLALLSDWTGAAVAFPPERGIFDVFYGNIAEYMAYSIPVAYYLAILLGLNYVIIRRILYPAAFPIILLVLLGISGAAYLWIESLDKTGYVITMQAPPGNLPQQGFIAGREGSLEFQFESQFTGNHQRIFLENPYKPGAAMAIRSQNQALNFHVQGDAPLAQIRLPFFTAETGFLSNLSRDFSRSSQIFLGWFHSGFLFYGLYAGSLAVLLLSLGCLIHISFWPLANLFFGALAFRGVLAMENFLNQAHIHQILASFAGAMFDERLTSPIIFCALSALILLYSGLVYLARGKAPDG